MFHLTAEKFAFASPNIDTLGHFFATNSVLSSAASNLRNVSARFE
jgi:hypothetical protein